MISNITGSLIRLTNWSQWNTRTNSSRRTEKNKNEKAQKDKKDKINSLRSKQFTRNSVDLDWEGLQPRGILLFIFIYHFTSVYGAL